MKKVLFTASTYSHINNFHLPYLRGFKELGYEVHVAVGGNKQKIEFTDKVYYIPFQKTIISIENFKLAYKLAKIINTEKYKLIITHTSLAAFFTRLGVFLSKRKPYVVNTVHGYLFDKNSPFIKRNIMLFAEKIIKPWTDDIIVTNKDDEKIAKKYKLYKKNLYFTNGMGVDFSKLKIYGNKCEIKSCLNIKKDEIILIYVAEFSNRKNQEMLIKALEKLPKNIKLILIGDGPNFKRLKFLSMELNLEERIIFTGYVKNIDYYYSIADIYVSSSRIEGLPFSIMEAMHMKLPLVVSDVKGNKDLVVEAENGYPYLYNDIDMFCDRILTLYNNKDKRLEFGKKSFDLSQKYSLEKVFETNMSYYIK